MSRPQGTILSFCKSLRNLLNVAMSIDRHSVPRSMNNLTPNQKKDAALDAPEVLVVVDWSEEGALHPGGFWIGRGGQGALPAFAAIPAASALPART